MEWGDGYAFGKNKFWNFETISSSRFKTPHPLIHTYPLLTSIFPSHNPSFHIPHPTSPPIPPPLLFIPSFSLSVSFSSPFISHSIISHPALRLFRIFSFFLSPSSNFVISIPDLNLHLIPCFCFFFLSSKKSSLCERAGDRQGG